MAVIWRKKKPQEPPFLPSAFSLYVWVYMCVYTCKNARRLVLTHILVSEVPWCVSHRADKERNRRGSSRRSRRGGGPGCSGQGCSRPGMLPPGRDAPPGQRCSRPRMLLRTGMLPGLGPCLPPPTGQHNCCSNYPGCPNFGSGKSSRRFQCAHGVPFVWCRCLLKPFALKPSWPLTYLPAGKSSLLVYLVLSGQQ